MDSYKIIIPTFTLSMADRTGWLMKANEQHRTAGGRARA